MTSPTVQRTADWPKRCIFCQGTPIRQEHIYSREWIRQLFPGIGLTVVGHEDAPQPGERSFKSRGAEVVSLCVCGDCNSGWMNALDQRAQSVAHPLITSLSRYMLAPEEQRLLATWATKITMMLDYAVTTSDRPQGVIKPPHHDRLFQDRLPPDEIYVWLAAQNQTDPWVVDFSDARQSPQPTLHGVPLLGERPYQMYVATFRVNHAIFQTFVPDPDSRWLPLRGGFHDFVTQIWPPTFKVASWPPSNILDGNRAMKALHESLGSIPTII